MTTGNIRFSHTSGKFVTFGFLLEHRITAASFGVDLVSGEALAAVVSLGKDLEIPAASALPLTDLPLESAPFDPCYGLGKAAFLRLLPPRPADSDLTRWLRGSAS